MRYYDMISIEDVCCGRDIKIPISHMFEQKKTKQTQVIYNLQTKMDN